MIARGRRQDADCELRPVAEQDCASIAPRHAVLREVELLSEELLQATMRDGSFVSRELRGANGD